MPIDIQSYDPANHSDWVARLHRYIEESGLRVWRDPDELRPLIGAILSQHSKQAEAYRAGKHALLGFFIAQLMRLTKGGADPEIATHLFKEQLEKS